MPEAPREARFPRAAYAVVLVAAALAFLPVLDAAFLNWDDDVYVTANPLVTETSPGQAGRILASYLSGNYHPLTVASHALDYRLFGLDPRAHHAVNLALHLLNAALVLRLLAALGASPAGALAGALLWALHPLRVEPVAWVTGRKDLLAALFSLGALLLNPAPGARRRGARLALSFGSLTLALLSKGTAVAVPAAMLLCDWLRGRRLREALRGKVPHLALAAVFAVVAVLARRSYQGVLDEGAYGGWPLVFLGVVRFARYFLLRSVVPVADPAGLYPPLPAGSVLLSPAFLIPAIALAALAAILVLSLRRTRTAAFGALFFAATMFPALAAPVLGRSADRFTYLPSVGLAYLAAALLGHLASRGRRAAALVLVGAGAAAAALGAESFRQARTWTSSESLWTATIAQYAGTAAGEANLAHARLYRGRARAAAGRTAEALEDYREALRLNPRAADFHNEYGMALGNAGRHAEAAGAFGSAIALEPGNTAVRFNRGVSRLALGDAAGAAEDFTAALAADPRNAPALLGRARARLAAGDAAGAGGDLEAYLRARPGDAEALALRDRAGGLPPR